MNGHGTIVRASPLHDSANAAGSGAALFGFQSGGVLLGYYFSKWGAICASTWDPEAGPDSRVGCTLIAPWNHTDRAPNDGDVIDAFLDAQASGQLGTAALILLGPPPTAE